MTSRLPPPQAASSIAAPALPTFRARPDRDDAVLAASRAIVSLFLRERSSAFSVKELAEHAGLSERTFYRYFPRKEDAIRPYVEAGLEHVLSHVRNAPRALPLREVLVAAHGDLLDAGLAHGGAAFLEVLNEQESLRAVWIQVVTDAESAFAQIVSERLGIAADSVQARFTGAAVVAAGRLAMQGAIAPGEARTPSSIFDACLALLSLPEPACSPRSSKATVD